MKQAEQEQLLLEQRLPETIPSPSFDPALKSDPVLAALQRLCPVLEALQNLYKLYSLRFENRDIGDILDAVDALLSAYDEWLD